MGKKGPVKRKNSRKILLLSKTEEEEKLGGPYKWAKDLLESFEGKKLEIKNFKTNYKLLFNGNLFKGIKRIEKSDIIHVYVSNLGIVLLAFYAKLRKKKIIYTCHGNFFEEWKKTKNYWLFLKYYLLAKIADYFTFPSEYIQKIIVKRMDKPSEVLYCSSCLEEEKKNKKRYTKYTFLQVTSFDYYKKGGGVLPLTRAFKKFNRVYPDSRLIIIGSGKHFEEIKKKAEGKNILFLGKQPKRKVAHYMQTCDCFIHITGLDNLPLTIIEATSFNKPVIASNKFGIPEISKDIYLTKNTTKDILEKMFEVYEFGERKREYRNIGKFHKSRTANQYLNLYCKLLQ
jgi:glycosyltransferase involved in cell wall biosynthesis